MPTSITILYGPWPLDNNPLLTFRLFFCVLDAISGLVLVISTFLAVRSLWLRHPPTLQFSLWNLFCAITLACLGVGLLPKIFDLPLLGIAILLLPLWIVKAAIVLVLLAIVDRLVSKNRTIAVKPP